MNDMGAYHSNSLLAARYRCIIIHDITNKVTMLSILFIRGSMPPNLSFQHVKGEEHGFSLTKIPIVLCTMPCNYYRENNQQPIVKQINCHLGNWVIGVEGLPSIGGSTSTSIGEFLSIKRINKCIKITQISFNNSPRNKIQIQLWKMPQGRGFQIGRASCRERVSSPV